MRRVIPLFLITLMLGACNTYNLRYKADPQPKNANIFADYVLLEGSVAVQVDTEGLRIEEMYIKTADGTLVRPINMSYPSVGRAPAVGMGVGVSTGTSGVGTGAGIPAGPSQTSGLITATFSAAALGPAPWDLHVKIEGVPEAVVPKLGGTPNAK